jgi:hypothetical protein
VPRKGGQCLNVRRQPGDQHARALALEEGHGEALQVLVRGDAQAAEETLPCPRGAHDDEPLEDRAGEHEREVRERRPPDRPFVAAFDPVVDRVLEERGTRHRDQRRADDPEQGERDQAAVRAHEAPRAREHGQLHAATSIASSVR